MISAYGNQNPPASLAKSPETTIEYGVHYWSKTLKTHDVHECGDLHTALSTLKTTRRKFDASAMLAWREVPVAPTPGEWHVATSDEAIASMSETRPARRAVTR